MKRTACGRFLLLAFIFIGSQSCPAQTTNDAPRPDVVATATFRSGFTYDKGASTWYASEREVFTELLSAGHFDWLVVPAQTQRQGFDRAERSMIAAELARAIVERHVSVPDPYLVERAFGDDARRVSLDEVDALARKLHINVIVIPYVGYDESGDLWATLEVYRKANNTEKLIGNRPVFLTARHPRVTDTAAPLDSFLSVMPELMTGLQLPGTQSGSSADRASKLSVPQPLPESPELLTQVAGGNSLDDAVCFSVLAELAPVGTRTSERLFERSLLAARRAEVSEAQKFLTAHALLHLNLRPAAVGILRDATSPDLIALRAIVNGNLESTTALVQRTSGYERVILEFEMHRLTRAYGHATDRIPMALPLRALARRSSGWTLLLQRQWDFGTEQSEDNNLALKRLLDQIYPVAGESLQEVIQARSSIPGLSLDPVDLELTAHEHIRHLITVNASAWCCSPAFYRPGSWDFLALLDAWTDVNAALAVEKELDFRGLPRDAKDILTRLDRVYSGHPLFELLQAETDMALARALPDTQRGALRKSAHTHALTALLASGGEPQLAVQAVGLLTPEPGLNELTAAFARDYPFDPAWATINLPIDASTHRELLRSALANTQTGVAYAEQLMLSDPTYSKAEIRAALQGRFAGNPDLERTLKQLDSDGMQTNYPGVETTIAALRKKVKAQPDVWDTRVELAAWLSANLRYSEAARVLATFPAFLDRVPSNPVYLSNIAAAAGHKFYWQGAQNEARELYRIATRYGVGSEAEMSAAMHLRLLNDDFPGALAEAERRADRYPSGISYYYYLCLLHLLGHSDQSWKAFEALKGRSSGPGLWEAAMVGLRMAGTSEADFQRWISRPEIKSVESPAVSWAAVLTLLWATTDRTVDPQLVERITTLNHEPRGIIEGTERVASYPSAQSEGRFLVIRSEFRADQRPPLDFGTRVPSDLPLFARALVPLQNHDFETAVKRFDELAARFPIEQETDNADAVYALPEFAYASAKTGDPLHLESYLKALPAGTVFFELALGHAYFKAVEHHDNTGALADLQQAAVLIEHHMGRTPRVEYQYANAAERIYRETGDMRFRERALGWCHLMQQLEPWAGWAYWIEVELSENMTERRAALVKAMFLDSQSPRLKSVSTADADWARAQLQRGNPFLREQQGKRTTL